MDFIDSLKQIAARIERIKDSIQTEEATKNALVLPFIRALGFDVFDPTEVIPEMACDVGMKKGEKIDYAIAIGGTPKILVECKFWKENLDKHSGQLFRYFGASATAKIGILTNGIVYRFFTDIDEQNRMDEYPFLELNLEDNLDAQIGIVESVKKFSKDGFDLDQILKDASESKYASDMERTLREELAKPEPEFVRFLVKKTYRGIVTPQILDKYAPLVRRAFVRIVEEKIQARLNSAQQAPAETIESDDPKIVTTDEEREGFAIVRSIACEIVDVSRVTMRDTQSYCGILLDDKKTKQICRLYFNTSNKRVAFVLPGGKEEFHAIDSVAGIYSLKGRILDAVRLADGGC